MIQNDQIELNSVVSRDEAPKGIQKKIPEGALYFEGVVSSGEKNRNGYTIESEAWFKDGGKSVKRFLKSGSVLFNHNPEQPIGRPLSFEKVGDQVVVSGYVFDDRSTQGAIGRGLILGLSTGHLTETEVFQKDGKGKKLTWSEYISLDMEEFFSGTWERIVTACEIAEFSFVTVPSNRSAVMSNSLDTKIEEYAKHKNLDPQSVRISLKNTVMNTIANSDESTETPKTPEAVEAVVETAVETVADVTTEPTETNSVDLSSKIAELEANFTTRLEVEVNKLKAQMEVEFAEKLSSQVATQVAVEAEKIRTEERDSLAKVYANSSGVVKTAEDFKAKHNA